MMHCPRCGEMLNDDAVFCSRCGLALNNVVIVNNTQPEVKASNVVKTTLIVIATLIVVALAILFGIYYFFFRVPSDDGFGVEDRHITFVKNGSPTMYPDVTYYCKEL